jgi:hypothetical protein
MSKTNNLSTWKVFINKIWAEIQKLPYFIASCGAFILLGFAFIFFTSLMIGILFGAAISNKIVTFIIYLISITISLFSILWLKKQWTKVKSSSKV